MCVLTCGVSVSLDLWRGAKPLLFVWFAGGNPPWTWGAAQPPHQGPRITCSGFSPHFLSFHIFFDLGFLFFSFSSRRIFSEKGEKREEERREEGAQEERGEESKVCVGLCVGVSCLCLCVPLPPLNETEQFNNRLRVCGERV